MTIDEELTLLDSQLRRLKIEYEIYFSNPTKRPPTDVEWKVLSLLRKFSDGGRMSFSQRFRYNEIAQRYAIYSDLWRKKNRIREEGYRRPQDALLSVQGVRVEEHEPEHKVYGVGHAAARRRGRRHSGRSRGPEPAGRRKALQHAVYRRAGGTRSGAEAVTTPSPKPRRSREKPSPATSTVLPRSCRRRPTKSANSTAAKPSSTRSKCRTAR